MQRPALILVLATLCAGGWAWSADTGPGEPEPHGMDVLGAAKTVQDWFGKGTPPSDKPWANDLGGLTSDEQRSAQGAIRNLVIQGRKHPEVLKDLAVLAEDKSTVIRLRVLEVCSGIGGEAATPLLIRFSNDRSRKVRELAGLGLGGAQGDAVLPRLTELLSAPESEIRQAAATSLGAFGDPRAIAALSRQESEHDDLVRREMRRSLAKLCFQPAAVPVCITLLKQLTDNDRDSLIEAVLPLPDPRLCPALTAIAADPGHGGRSADASAWTQLLTVRALAASGDYRAVPTLVALADSDATTDVQRAAAQTLLPITGYSASPGKAWRVWIADHQAQIAMRAERDAYFASLQDPTVTPDPARLAALPVSELEPLVEAVLNRPAGRLTPWWPARALAILRADDHLRWLPPIAARIIRTPTPDLPTRLGLIILLDDLAPLDQVTELADVLKDLKQRLEHEQDVAKEQNLRAPDHGPEIEMLKQALARRGVKAPL
jgi:HEAT repeat protein